MTGYEIAQSMIGLNENKDTIKLDNFILKWVPQWKGMHVNTTSWCAAFVSACERQSGKSLTGRLAAREFLKYGIAVANDEAEPGDIVVFSRGGSTWQGHVAYFDGYETGDEGLLVRTIGGNQSDSVSKGWYAADRLLGFRRG